MKLGVYFLLISACSIAVQSQEPAASEPVRQERVPIYRVTVERRAIRAVNYGHRSVPTRIDFRGTVLLPRAKGGAKVEARAGAVEIDAKFENLEAPARFGPEYLTYVLWAITPDGRPVNLGELLTDGSDSSKLKVTTQLQAFGLIVTAEPYFAVTQPSNVVVLENMLRPDTVGKVEEIEAKYELLPRSQTPLSDRPVEMQAPSNGGKRISLDEYEALLAIYQAQNALQIARAQGAGEHAASTLQRAEQLYQEAQRLNNIKADSKSVVMTARQAAQAAEDARTIAAKHAGVISSSRQR